MIDRSDAGGGQPSELGGRPLHRATRLLVGVEEVARHQDHVDLLGQGEVDRPTEGVELPLALGGRCLAEVVVSSAEMDVGQVQESRHLGGSDLPVSVRRWWQLSQANGAMRARSPLDALARGLRLGCHCATLGGTSDGQGVAKARIGGWIGTLW